MPSKEYDEFAAQIEKVLWSVLRMSPKDMVLVTQKLRTMGQMADTLVDLRSEERERQIKDEMMEFLKNIQKPDNIRPS